MKRRKTCVIGAGLLAASAMLSGAAMMQAATGDSPRRDEKPLAKTAQSIDIMRRVIVKSINLQLAEYSGADKDKKSEGDRAVTTNTVFNAMGVTGYTYASGTGAFSSFASDSRGHYVPGHGAVFSLQVIVPSKAVDAESKKDETETGDGDDLWSQAEREASGRTDILYVQALVTNKSTPSKVIIRDEQAIERAIDAVIEAVGRHGTKIEGIDDGDSIIVALDVRGGAVQVNDSPGAVAGGATLSYSLFSTVAQNGAGEEHIVIEVAMEDIGRYAGKRIDLDGLREKARITRY